jgi:thymidylate kinase
MMVGLLVLEMISTLESEGILSVYLRNYENLPDAVGNDVDLLVPAGRRSAAIKILMRVAAAKGWSYLGSGHFSPVALYFANLETTETLHLDLFDRIEWHFLEFADAAGILARRVWNGKVHIPAAGDEVYLNVVTRLIYHGNIREKHRLATETFLTNQGEDALHDAFRSHLGQNGVQLATDLAGDGWEGTASTRKQVRSAAMKKFGLLRPAGVAKGLGRYGCRIVRKFLRPPGHFLVLEGADGVGKSTILSEILPWCSEWCAGRETYDFHWKPVRLSTGPKPQAAAVNPRGKSPRSVVASFCYLVFHLLGFWQGWLLRIYPLLAKSHPVVGDRYSYDLFLDPSRFRLRLPLALCRFAALLAPCPEVTVGLMAPPETIHARKPELELHEIAGYQARWESLSAGRRRMVTVSAEGKPEDVVRHVKQAILKVIANDRSETKR